LILAGLGPSFGTKSRMPKRRWSVKSSAPCSVTLFLSFNSAWSCTFAD